MRFKRLISFCLCVILALMPLSVSADAKVYQQSSDFCISTVGDFTGSVMSIIVREWNKLFNKNEQSVPEPSVNPPSWENHDGGIIDNPQQTIVAKCWVMEEVTYISEKIYADPFNDVSVDLILFGNGRSYKIPAFWDGDNVWKVRFACPSEGDWYFKTVCSDEENSSLHNRTGKVVCSEYDGEHDIYKHGFVTTNQGKKYFTYDDGTPFFYLGDTHWSLGDETTDMVKTICEKRASQGFTVYQSEPIGAKFDFTNGITQEDMAGFDDYDDKFAIIASNGLVHANAQFFFTYFMEPLIANNGGYTSGYDLAAGTKQYLEKISRYWVARYGAYPVIWTLGQESDNDFYWSDTSHPEWNYKNNPYKLVAEYIAKYDAYDHPLSAHQENAGSTCAYGNGDGATDECTVYFKDAQPSCFRDVDAHDFYAAQWHISKTEQDDFRIAKDYWFNSQGKPAINYEGQYCYLWTKNYGSRMQGWTAYLNGMYGYGWGGHDTWSYLNIFDEENDSSDGVDTITSEEKINATWQDALEYESSYQVGYMREFFETIHWYDLVPRFDDKSYFIPSYKAYYTYASNADNSEIVIYFYSFTDASVAEKANTSRRGGTKTGVVGNLEPRARYTYQWFNPISGEFSEKTEFNATIFGTCCPGNKPQATDMVLLIQKV